MSGFTRMKGMIIIRITIKLCTSNMKYFLNGVTVLEVYSAFQLVISQCLKMKVVSKYEKLFQRNCFLET